jgi:ribosome-binding factor A
VTTRRPERVGDLVRSEISSLLLRGELHDPGIGFVTITQVKMSSDLKSARVYFSCLGGEESFENTRLGFERAAGFLRREIGRRCRLRYAPELHFFPDHTAETGARIERILQESRTESAPGESDGAVADSPEDET